MEKKMREYMVPDREKRVPFSFPVPVSMRARGTPLLLLETYVSLS